MTHAAVYVRVSTEDQAKEGFSLAAQEERLRAYCQARGWDISQVYTEDGYSGRDIKRPAYKRMLEERDTWDTLLVLKMDRIHRNSRNFMSMMENLGKAGKEFVSATESLDTSTAMGRFVVDMIQRIAQLESETIGERVYMGMKQKAKDGPGLLGFPAPIGYDLENGRLIVNAEEAKTVSAIFSWCLEGRTTEEIALALNGLYQWTKRGLAWNRLKVYRTLHNPIYAGRLHWDGIEREGEHVAIVTPEDFEAAQDALRSRQRGIVMVRDIEKTVERLMGDSR